MIVNAQSSIAEVEYRGVKMGDNTKQYYCKQKFEFLRGYKALRKRNTLWLLTVCHSRAQSLTRSVKRRVLIVNDISKRVALGTRMTVNTHQEVFLELHCKTCVVRIKILT